MPGSYKSAWIGPADAQVAEDAGCPLLIRVIGNFELLDRGTRLSLSQSAQRLLAVLAVADKPLGRAHVAAQLWPKLAHERAQAALRSTLWRLRSCAPAVIAPTQAELRLSQAVMTDIRTVRYVMDSLLDDSHHPQYADLMLASRLNLREDLLTTWADEWITAEREAHNQLRVHALEALAYRLIDADCRGKAIDAALAAVRADPYRESAQAAAVLSYLAEGNLREARRRVEQYRDLLRQDLDAEPSPEFSSVVDTFLRKRSRACPLTPWRHGRSAAR